MAPRTMTSQSVSLFGFELRWLQGFPAGWHVSQVYTQVLIKFEFIEIVTYNYTSTIMLKCISHAREGTQSWEQLLGPDWKYWAWMWHTKLGECLAVTAKHSNANRPHAITLSAKVGVCHGHAKLLRVWFSGCIYSELGHSGPGSVLLSVLIWF